CGPISPPRASGRGSSWRRAIITRCSASICASSNTTSRSSVSRTAYFVLAAPPTYYGIRNTERRAVKWHWAETNLGSLEGSYADLYRRRGRDRRLPGSQAGAGRRAGHADRSWSAFGGDPAEWPGAADGRWLRRGGDTGAGDERYGRGWAAG